MSKVFHIGDHVSWIDEDLQGVVIQVTKTSLLVETNDGFEINALPSEVILLPRQAELKLDWDALHKAKVQELQKTKPKKSIKSTASKKNIPALEVDLHIHELVVNTNNLSNFDMLNIQLDTAKRQIQFAKQKRIKRVILIHGVGQGVLKAELETILRRDEEVDFYDADYTTYGLGATEVYIYENTK